MAIGKQRAGISARPLTAPSHPRWILPQGAVEPGTTLLEAAAMEAWEEAGVEGEVETTPFTFYEYETGNGNFHVFVFRMHVKHEENDWPEKADRLRQWHSLGEAISIVSGEPLRNVLSQFRSQGFSFTPPKL